MLFCYLFSLLVQLIKERHLRREFLELQKQRILICLEFQLICEVVQPEVEKGTIFCFLLLENMMFIFPDIYPLSKCFFSKYEARNILVVEYVVLKSNSFQIIAKNMCQLQFPSRIAICHTVLFLKKRNPSCTRHTPDLWRQTSISRVTGCVLSAHCRAKLKIQQGIEVINPFPSLSNHIDIPETSFLEMKRQE